MVNVGCIDLILYGVSSFSAGDDFRDLGLRLKMPRSGTLDGQLTLRPASTCALQGSRVAWWPIRPAHVLGGLSLRGPLGLALGFYRAQVQRLDIARFDRKHEPGATDSMSTLPTCYPCAVRASATWLGGFRRAVCSAALCRSGSPPFPGIKSCSSVSGGGGTREKEEKVFETIASFFSLGKMKFCAPSSKADASKIDVRSSPDQSPA